MTGEQLGVLRGSVDEIVESVTGTFEEAGLRVYRSFDLRTARSASIDCTCPHHGTADCDCQMVVLLIYGASGQPATLVLHGYDEHAWVVLAETPDPELEEVIATALNPSIQYSVTV